MAGVVSIFCHLPRRVRVPSMRLSSAPCGRAAFSCWRRTPRNNSAGAPAAPGNRTCWRPLADLAGELAGLRVAHARELDREVPEGAYHTGLASVVLTCPRG